MTFIKRFTGLALVLLFLAACDATQDGGALPQNVANAQSKSHRIASWMDPNAPKLEMLLYVTNGTNVEVYNYKTRKLVGLLTGFRLAFGSCEDRLGNVWIADYDAQTIGEYARGTTQPLHVLATAGGPDGCAIDPTTGNLATTNAASDAAANLEVWPQAGGTPVTYSSEQCWSHYDSPGYDDKGNLYVEDGLESGYGVCEVPAGGSAISQIAFDTFISTPGGVVWDGKHMTVVDAGPFDSPHPIAQMYRARRTGHGLKTIARVTIGDSSEAASIHEPFVVGNKNTPANRKQGSVVVSSNGAGANGIEIDTWSYPAGGGSTATFPIAPNNVGSVSVSFRPNRL